jgi:hypothetical protein
VHSAKHRLRQTRHSGRIAPRPWRYMAAATPARRRMKGLQTVRRSTKVVGLRRSSWQTSSCVLVTSADGVTIGRSRLVSRPLRSRLVSRPRRRSRLGSRPRRRSRLGSRPRRRSRLGSRPRRSRLGSRPRRSRLGSRPRRSRLGSRPRRLALGPAGPSFTARWLLRPPGPPNEPCRASPFGRPP